MKMICKITPVEKFKVDICGETKEFSVESEWESFIKLVNNDGSIIINDSSCFIDQMFQTFFDKKDVKEFEIVSISPSLVPKGWSNKSEKL